MINNIEFADLILTWDVHEQANVEGKPRVKRITDWFVARGGLVDTQALPLGDYHIGGGYDKATKTFLLGTFRGKEINLLIEYKTFVDLNNSKEDLPWKLFEAGKLCPEIALFVEENNIQLSFTEKGSFIKIPQVPDGSANITNYQGYKNMLDSFASDGIHVRTFQSEIFFEEDVYSLLIYLAKDGHTGLHVKGKEFKTTMLNVLCKLDGIGGVKANKLISVIPNLQMLIEYCNYDNNGVLESLIGVIGAKTLKAFVNNTSRVKECREKYRIIFGTLPEPIPKNIPHEKIISKEEIKHMADAIYDYIACYPDGREPQQICDYFNCGESSDDKKQLLICVKKLAEIGRVTSDTKGIFKAVKDIQSQLTSHLGIPNVTPGISNDNRVDSKERSVLLSSNEKIPLPDSMDIVRDVQSLRGHALVHDIPENIEHKEDGYIPINLDIPGISQSPPQNDIIPPPPILTNCGDDSRTTDITPRTSDSFTYEFNKEVIHSLDDIIVDFCYDSPKADFSIISYCQSKGYQIPEIHKAMIRLAKTKLHKFKEGGQEKYSYKGVKAILETDIGV